MRIPHPTASVRVLLALALALAMTPIGAQSPPPYSIDFHSLSAGARVLSNACVRLAGSVAETAPGYSSNATYALLAGFRAATAGQGVDEIFFAGFEEC
jgi:hypothetical protein